MTDLFGNDLTKTDSFGTPRATCGHCASSRHKMIDCMVPTRPTTMREDASEWWGSLTQAERDDLMRKYRAEVDAVLNRKDHQ